MTGMCILRNRRFRRWVASGLAVTWLFTVLACAMDTDAIAADPIHATQSASLMHSNPAPHHDGDTKDDTCCQAQSSAIISFNVFKLPHLAVLPVIVPIALLLKFAVQLTLLSVTVVPDRNTDRRRFRFLVHSLQAQAPPR